MEEEVQDMEQVQGKMEQEVLDIAEHCSTGAGGAGHNS